jgi:hypothetical protein
MLPGPPSLNRKSSIQNQKLTVMKRIALTFGLLFAMQAVLLAQLTDVETVVFNAHLLKTFNLNVLNGATQDATFTTAADYNNGVIEGAGIASGTTDITVEATGNWNLSISAPNFMPYVGPNGAGTGVIPVNNLGVWLEATGVHQFGTEVTCPYIDLASAMGMAIANQILIGLGTANNGDAADNAFTMHWQMGQAAACPLMNPLTMFQQMSAGAFGPGDFTTTCTLTLTEIP